jgi:RND family efflux transporter MFP subunit
VATAPIQDSSAVIANLDSRSVATLNPQVSGQLTQVQVQLGDQVQAGQPLFRIDTARQEAVMASRKTAIQVAEANVDNARRNLSAAQAARAALEAELEFSRSQQQRNLELQAEGVISREALDESNRDLRRAEADVASQEEQIRALEAAVIQAERDLEQAQAVAQEQEVELRYYQVTAPLAGRVGEVLVKEGDYVTPSTVLTTVVQDQILEVEMNVPLEASERLRLGTPVQLLGPDGSVLLTSQVSFIAPEVNQATQAVLAKALFDNSQGQLRTSQFVRVRLIWEEEPRLVIPFTAVSRLAGQTFVFTVEAGEGTGTEEGPPSMIAAQKPVQLGQLQDNQYEVLSGLEAGEQIVVSGLQKIFDQAPIVDEAQMSGGGGPPGQENGSLPQGG